MTQEASAATSMLGSIVYAIIILAAGYWGAKAVSGMLKSFMERSNLDQALSGFVGNLVNPFSNTNNIVATFALVRASSTVCRPAGVQILSLQSPSELSAVSRSSQ